MAQSTDAYFKHQEGDYVPADASETISINWTKLLLRFTINFVLTLPYHVQDFLKAYIWAPKKCIKGRVVLVSGGANGLGRALCLRFAREGCKIAVVDIDLKGAIKTAAEIRSLGAEVEAFRTDVSDVKSVQQLKKDIETTLGPVQILVNNAGLLANASMNEGTDEELQKIIDVNLSSHFWMIRQFLPRMIEENEGHIVAISSVLGLAPNFRCMSYSATKYGIRGLMTSLSDNLYFRGLGDTIYTTCIYPDLITTRKQLVDMCREVGMSSKSMSPELAANQIVDGVLRNKSEIILTPFFQRSILKFHGILSERIRRIATACICEDANYQKRCVYEK